MKQSLRSDSGGRAGIVGPGLADRRLLGLTRGRRSEHHRRLEIDLVLRLGELGELKAAVEELVG
jgi:hypothetical protein